MPLVWELDNELKAWLTPTKLRDLNRHWRSGGTAFGHPDAAIDELAGALERQGMHYESVLGYLETLFRRPRRDKAQLNDAYHGLYLFLVEIIYILLQQRHILNLDLIERNIQYLEGISALARENKPLWIFSLNHDLIIECLMVHANMPSKSGFSEEMVKLPLRDSCGVSTGELEARILRGDVIDGGALPYFRNGEMGVNLFKLHGSLDVFAFRDGKDLIKLVPSENSIRGVVETLRRANEELRYVDSDLSSDSIKATNEIIYADDVGEMQFLRRTLLAGAYKFEDNFSQVLPSKLLDHFSRNLNYLTTLVCIGYGFGDNHVNRVLREWLSFSHERRLTIVSPDANSVPSALLHLAPQIDLVPLDATTYLDQVSGITRDRLDILERRYSSWKRKNPDEADSKFASFVNAELEDLSGRWEKWIQTLPTTDGDIDLETLGLSLEELSNLAIKNVDIPNVADTLENFLKQQENSR